MPGSPFFQAMFTIVSKTLRALEALDHALGAGRNQIVFPVRVATASMNGSVTATEMLKLVSRCGLLLARDELEDVRVVDPQDAHVGAPPRAALLDRLGGRVEHGHEGDRPPRRPWWT